MEWGPWHCQILNKVGGVGGGCGLDLGINHTVGEVICLAPSVLRAGQRKWTVGGGCYSLYILLLYSLAFSLEPFSTLLESGVSPSLCPTPISHKLAHHCH